jgi:hypothetical protein
MKKSIILALFVLFISLSACGGGGGGGDSTSSQEPEVINIQAVDLSVSMTEGAAITFNMKALDTDISTLSCNIETNPSHGTLKQISGATWKYTPNEDFSGIDKLVYFLSKGSNKSNSAIVTITVETTGKIIYVTPSGSTENSGSSWSEALKHPQDAMDKAESGDQIWVAEGTYYALNSSKPEIPVLALKEGIRIYGGFKGDETYRSERNLKATASILDGQKTIYHVVKGAPSSRMDGFTIRNGNAKVNDSATVYPEETGGGMLNIDCRNTLTISNCLFIDNNAKNSGGGMTNQGDSSPKILNCHFIHNNASTSFSNYFVAGGAIFNSEGTSPYIANCLFQGNNGLGGGGAIGNYKATLSLINCTTSGNNANAGGAINSFGSTLLIRNCIIWNDTSEIINESSHIDISYSDIQDVQLIAGGTGNIYGDPAFTDSGSWSGSEWNQGDYHLKTNSPCIDAADGDSAPAIDMDGQPRLDILTITNTGTGLIPYTDMGVYEYIP